jgi:hypothetical protein
MTTHNKMQISIELGPNLERLIRELFDAKKPALNKIIKPLNGSQRSNLSNRISPESLQIIKQAFDRNTYISDAELAHKAGVGRKTVNSLRLVQRECPELLEHVFTDRLSVAAADVYRRGDKKEQPVLTPSRI